MSAQNLKNHIRFYTPHHFVFYPFIGFAFSLGLYQFYHSKDFIWIFISSIFFFIGWLSFMMRQHYALTNQNRIVRLEMRFRYFVLTGKRFDDYEKQLSFSQIAALRFASDSELPSLMEKTIKNSLNAAAIKSQIESWTPDDMRV